MNGIHIKDINTMDLIMVKSRNYHIIDDFMPEYMFKMIRHVALNLNIEYYVDQMWSKKLHTGKNVGTNRVLCSDSFYFGEKTYEKNYIKSHINASFINEVIYMYQKYYWASTSYATHFMMDHRTNTLQLAMLSRGMRTT